MDRWYIVYTQPRAEDKALWHLRNQGFRCFLPKLQRTIRHARRQKTVLEALFPRYLFTMFDGGKTRWRSINGTHGVIHLLTHGPEPIPVPGGIVEGLLRDADELGLTPLSALGLLWPGRKVRINVGPFAGQIAEVDQAPLDGRARVRLLLSVLGGKTPLELPSRAIGVV